MTGRARPRVAVVTSTIPVTVHAFHRELLRQLGEAGFEVLVVSSPGPELDLLAATPGVRVAAIPMSRDIDARADSGALRKWVRLLRNERPALVVTATPKASLLGMVAARLTGVPRRAYYVGGLRLEGEHGRRRRLLAATERLTSASAHVVIANSPSLAREVLAHRLTRVSKLRVIKPASSHGVDTERFAPRARDAELRARLGLVDDLPVVGFVGRVTADKGVGALLSALHLLRQRAVAVQLLVLGAQNESDSAGWVSRLRGESRVVLAGHVDDIRPYVALMDVHVLPSRREGFPNVVLETGAMGVPTVTMRATGAIDSVRDGETGLLVDVDDARQLADAVGRLLADPGLAHRLGAAAREVSVRDFQPAEVVASFVGHILGTRAPRA